MGPGTVAFGSPTSVVTSATFSTNGIYVLQLKANDSLESSADLMEVRVGVLCSVKAPDALVAWWPGNLNPSDVIGGRTVLLQNPSYGVGEVGPAFQFNGANDFGRISAASALNVGPGANGFSLEFWISPAGGQDGSVLGWANGVRVERFRVGNNNGDALRFYVGTGTVSFVQTPMLWTSANWGSWHHVALTCDRDQGLVKVYFNGVLSEVRPI